MSFPNSGTSYTLREIERLSNFSTATNYGKRQRSELVYADLPQGPRCRGVSDKWYAPIPKEYVLVKTHCTGYGMNDGASALKRGSNDFLQGCATTRPFGADAEKGYYEPALVHKAIHIVRNPFHNLISRYNCEHKLVATSGGDRAVAFAEKYPKNAQGFRSFCQDLDADFDEQYSRDMFQESKRHEVKHTRCHDDIISYVTWHNHAFDTCRELHLPTMLVHYEDYEDDQNMTFTNMLDFLHLQENARPKEFTARHDYQAYFTGEDRQRIKMLIKQLASNQTWKAVSHYFEE
jgi:hypothetical protein